jgi:spore coat protein U-like protein
MTPFAWTWRSSLVLCVAGSWSGVAGAGCTLTATGIAFGVYNPSSATPLDSNGALTVTCTLDSGVTQNFNFTAVFGTGNGTYASRYMLRSGGTERLYYNAYNAGYAQVYGNGSGGTASFTGRIRVWFFDPSNSLSTTVAGRIPQTQNAVPGSYADSLMVTLTF